MVEKPNESGAELAAIALEEIRNLSRLIRPRPAVTVLKNADARAYEYRSVHSAVEGYRSMKLPCPAKTIEREQEALVGLLQAHEELVNYIHSHRKFDEVGRPVNTKE